MYTSKQSQAHATRLQRNFDKYAVNNFLEKNKFQHVLVEEIVDAALKKAQCDTLQRWEDLTQLGVLEEVWDACFGFETSKVQIEDLMTAVFKKNDEEKSEAEKLLDLCSEDEALRNHVYDLEECLQSNKDMLAASDILVEEQGEKMKNMEEELRKRRRDAERMKKQEKELEALKMKVKNMESEHRLLKRDFDLVFATNKTVQKRLERTETENQALRKTIITLANQLEKNERERMDGGMTSPLAAAPVTVIPAFQVPTNDALNVQISTQAGGFVPQDGQYAQTYTTSNYDPAPSTKPPHMVWDPAIRSLVPITGDQARKNKRRDGKGKKRWKDNSGVNNGKLISPFPRRYTSSHLARYRRKFEITEKSRYDKQSTV